MDENLEKLLNEKTVNIVNELAKREAVKEIEVKPYKKIELLIDGEKVDIGIEDGPARILIVWD